MKFPIPGCLPALLFLMLLQPASAIGNMAEPQAGVEEKTGSVIPLNLSFYDEGGRKAKLNSLLDKPAILSFAYFNCTNFCNEFLGNLAESLDSVASEAGKDYTSITVSFDEKDTPFDASKKKSNYIGSFKRPFQREGWRFLTGDEENIRALASSVGFSFNRDGNAFRHPVALIVLSPEGRIIRYINGDRFIPSDIDMAVLEAKENRTGATIPKALFLCYSYDPQKRAYVFSFMKASGFFILFSAAAFFIYLTSSNKKKKD